MPSGNALGSDEPFAPSETARRVQAVAHGAVGALPRTLRARVEARSNAGDLERLTEVMTAWSRGAGLSKDRFATLFLAREANDPIVGIVREASRDAIGAVSRAELREASLKVADAIPAVGLDRWPRFLADAQARARDPTARLQ